MSRPRTQAAVDGRRRAVEAVLSWKNGRTETVSAALEGTPRTPDGALARELAIGAVIWQRLYDHLTDRFLKGTRQPEVLRVVLRIMAHQLFALDRIPPHAAVGESVQVLRFLGEKHLVPVANAVGRKLAALRQEERFGEGPCGRLSAADTPTSLGIRHSLPDLLIDDLRAALPTEDVDTCLAALNHIPPLCTRTRAGCAPLIGQSIIRSEGDWTWWENPAEAIALVNDQRCVVQDRTQGEVAEIARIRPGVRVLDLCAAPGGKAKALNDLQAEVIAADISRTKLRDLSGKEFAGRLVVQDGIRPAFAPGSFEVVVIDAPCSNSGVLARRPEARWRYDKMRQGSLEQIQRKLIRAGAELVAPGGRLVYSTCSLTPRENQGITHLLDGWRILAERVTWPGPWHLGGYACLLVRTTAS